MKGWEERGKEGEGKGKGTCSKVLGGIDAPDDINILFDVEY